MTRLDDTHWLFLAPLLPPQPTRGRKRRQDRMVSNSLIYRLKTGCRYRDIPRTSHYAAPSTTHYWPSRWTEEGFITRLWQQLLSLLEQAGGLDLSRGSLDGSFVPAKRGYRIVRVARGNGSNLMVASEAFVIPIGFQLTAANQHDSPLALDTLSTVRVPRLGRGRPKTRILAIAMDKGFDIRELRRALSRRGIRASIPLIKRRGKRRQRGPRPKLYPVSRERYKVERVNVWLDNYRALVVRYERTAEHYLGFCQLSASLMCLKRLTCPSFHG